MTRLVDGQAAGESSAVVVETATEPRDAIPTMPASKDLGITERYSSALVFNYLHRHFFLEVVPRFRWIDLPENPWRNTIQPIAPYSLCLRLAMASHAAAHLSVACARSADERARFRFIYQRLRDSSLRIVNERIRSDFLCDQNSSRRCRLPRFPTDIRASTVLLCYADAFIPGSTDWRLHLRACQTVIRSQVVQGKYNGLRSPSETFLLKEVADIEILNGISVFDEKASPITAFLFEHIHSESPWTFTKLLSEITIMERSRYTSLRYRQHIPEVRMQLWHQRAEGAYYGLLAALASFPMHQQARGCLETVILSHYYAIIIYSYQALAPPDKLDDALESCLGQLQQCVHSIIYGSEQQFSHDLFIPLFILGTECRGDRNKQLMVEDLFLKVLIITGMWWNHTALQFLRIFWSSLESDDIGWIQFARDNEAQVGNFILF
ncbi:fungal-specific transcription factor domain-containing protein [Aspergillus pseudonomiae]|nr:fungal-specific transcription factor domain-containing protein [Aspergillus pseudonomiae]